MFPVLHKSSFQHAHWRQVEAERGLVSFVFQENRRHHQAGIKQELIPKAHSWVLLGARR